MSNPVNCSVLICTYNRAALLQGTLESLCHQTLQRSAFEVIVVDDGSQDGTCDIVGGFEPRLNLRYAYQCNSGLASARNHALFLSQGEIVILIDDDDVAAPELLAEHLGSHQAHPQDNVAVLGYTDLGREIATDPLMHFVTEDGAFLFSYADIRHGQVLGFSYFWGGRSSCKRRFLLQQGTFNPVFRFGCEDIELAFRLSKHGLRVVYNARAITSMVRAYSFDQFCDRLIKQGRSNFVFSQLHSDPEVREWTEVDEIAKWDKIEPVYEMLRKAGRDLDAIFRYKRKVGIDTAEDREILYQTYRTAFRASKIKGLAEATTQAGGYIPSALPQSDTAARAVRYASLDPSVAELLTACPPIHGNLTWGLSEDALAYLDEQVEDGWRTLETGSGLSTLVFAKRGAYHTCITPFPEEVARIEQFCRDRDVNITRLSFLIGWSHEVLPTLSNVESLDLVLIDGGHGFPIPFVDWLYCARKIRLDGMVIVDDTQLWTAAVLRDFLDADPDWQLERHFVRGVAFRKVNEFRLKEWNEQAYVVAHSKPVCSRLWRSASSVARSG